MARVMPLLLLLLFALGQAWSMTCGVPVIREGAADLVTATFKKRFHRTDFTKIDVDLTPLDLVEDSACVNGDEMVLLYNNDGGENWTTADVRPTWIVGTHRYRFTMDDIVPCRDHYFRILLFGEGR